MGISLEHFLVALGRIVQLHSNRLGIQSLRPQGKMAAQFKLETAAGAQLLPGNSGQVLLLYNNLVLCV